MVFNQSGLPDDVQNPVSDLPGRFQQIRSAGVPSSGKKVSPVARAKRVHLVSKTIDVTPVPAVIAAAAPGRLSLAIQNLGSVTVYVGFGQVPGADGSGARHLAPGGEISFESGFAPENDVYALCPAASRLSITEGRRV